MYIEFGSVNQMKDFVVKTSGRRNSVFFCFLLEISQNWVH